MGAIMDDNFNWGDDDSIVVQPVAAIAVYATEKGLVCIRREAAHGGEDDAFVLVQPRDIAALVREIRKVAAEIRGRDK